MKLAIVMAGLLAVPAMAPLPARASDVFSPPKGCTGFLTVQMHGCIVSNHYTCKGEPAGDKWRVDLDQNGPFFISRIDNETQWVETYDLAKGEHSLLDRPSKDPASFSTLLSTGRDDYDFSTTDDDGETEHVTGYDKLTGQKLTVSGVVLEETEFDTSAHDAGGKLLWQSKGHEYIDRAMRLFFSGKGTWTDDSGTTPYDNRPAAIIRPGGKGFLSATPEYDCNTVMSELVLPRQADGS